MAVRGYIEDGGNPSGLPAGALPVYVNGSLVGTRPALDFEDGANVTLTGTDDAGNDRVQVAVASTGGGGGGGMTKLFDSTLVSDTANIDTGAGGIVGGYDVLYVWAITRTDEAAAAVLIDFIVNNDTSAIYDREQTFGVSTTTGSAASVAQTSWRQQSHGSGGGAGYPAVCQLIIPGYAATAFNKVGTSLVAQPDNTAGNNVVGNSAIGYRSTAAISQLKVAAVGAAKLKTGSRLLIFGA